MEKEYLKMAMLKHEETFRQQVHELHRLYRTQKTLMKNIERSRQKGWNSESCTRNEICFSQLYHPNTQTHYKSNQTFKLDLEKPASEEPEDKNGVLQTIIESEIELTLGPSSYSTSESTLSSSSTGSSNEGIHTVTTEPKKGQEVEISGVIETSLGCQNGSNVREKKRLDYDYPPRIFQVVSLKTA